jgi:hypothetical protein
MQFKTFSFNIRSFLFVFCHGSNIFIVSNNKINILIFIFPFFISDNYKYIFIYELNIINNLTFVINLIIEKRNLSVIFCINSIFISFFIN